MASLEDLTPEARDELALLARELSDDPETREAFLRLTKKRRPNLTIDSIDLKDEMARKLDEERNRVDQLEGKLRERDALDSLKERREKLLKTGKIQSEEEIEEVEKVMLEKKIHDHDTAAEYYKWMKQAATPTPSAFESRNVLNEQARNTLSGFFRNPVGHARDEAAKALNELRKNPRPIGF